MSSSLRKNLTFLLSFFLVSILVLVPAKAGFAEKWTLRFTSTATMSGGPGTGRMIVEATGKAELTISENNVLTGNGQMAVTAKVTGPGISGFGQGNGSFTVTGRRDGEYLYFQFQGADIPVNGTVKAGAMSMPLDYSFSPSLVAPVEVTIERIEGATNPRQEV